MSEDFMVSVEGVFSSIRTSKTTSKDVMNWKSYTKRYAALGQPLGAMVLQHRFMKLLVSCSSFFIASSEQLQQSDMFDILMSKESLRHLDYDEDGGVALVELLSEVVIEEMRLLDDGADYLQLGSAWQQRLAFAVKAQALIIFLNCMIVDEEIADLDRLMSWLENSMADSVQMADNTLACVVLKSMAVVARFSSTIASTMSRSLPRFIVQGGVQGETITVAARSLTYIFQLLSQDAAITGLYSLGNVLSTKSNADKQQDNSLNVPGNVGRYGQHSTGSAISLDLSGDEEIVVVYGNIVRAIVSIASDCQDEKITALALSMLLQKLGRIGLAVDLHIITGAAALATTGGSQELKSLLKLYSRISHDAEVQSNDILIEAVLKARVYLSHSLRQGSPLYEIYQIYLLESIISKGDVHESDNTHQADIDLAAREIAQLLRPLACLSSAQAHGKSTDQDERIADLYREAWFNILVHGITPHTTLGQKYSSELQSLAMQSMPLIAEDRADRFESDIELNTVLRRGMNAPHTAEQKRILISLIPRCESDIRGLSYPKVLFLSATYLVETLRAEAGVCHYILTYFLDPSLNGSAMENCMVAISDEVVSIYLKRNLIGQNKDISAPFIAKQLALIFAGCCHRIARVQQVAITYADRIISQMPSSLCQKSSLFALLELLTIMWTSCLEAEIDEYAWRSKFTSTRGEISIELSDNYELRKSTLNNFYKRARLWVIRVINTAPMDVKGLLQTYLSEYDDDGAYGHVALGRSFALEMGSVIPPTDQKLGAIDRHGDWNINTASDFVAQYTTRQEYRYADALPDYDGERPSFLHNGDRNITSAGPLARKIEDDRAILAHLERRTLNKDFVPIGELRDILRRAAAILSRTSKDQCAVVRHLVSIPFAIFTKQAIKLGISLWLSIINENPRLESIVLAEIAESWEHSVRNHMGVFSEKLFHPDPFYTKEEFAPSDKGILSKQQQLAHDLIAPHLRIIQFLASHFNATRLGSPHTQRIFHRLIIITLDGLKNSSGHPLARETHFQIILFSLNFLKYCTRLNQAAQWRLKDATLSAALAWFSHQPRWSFGGNRLQIKAEARLMTDVETALRAVTPIGHQNFGTLHSLGSKQELLLLLLDNEKFRLEVWLYPLDHERKHLFTSGNASKTPLVANFSTLLRCAWTENPSLAIQLATRFNLNDDVRWLLLNCPEKALDEPDALQILLGSSLQPDVSFQLKYLIYWTAVNPVTAVTYFLPEYKNDPFVLQYAMRALESHSVDVTFFYVPQIVQTLRYDALGYVQRYIIETAKFSQLFAHQIIWNMKANAYKDEDSSVEDVLKPTLDVVMNNMIQSFSQTDKAFYEREFSFFNEITDISGKLRPFIKSSKEEKKQKIEEELRKIKVEVGVYLPSNPEGIVIGIDRKSGKPLQSHAKAPYLATFRIKKNRGEMEGTDDMLEKANQNRETGQREPVSQESTYEVWQSAIFKVGDDCRQDVLALQLIAAFRGIFNNVGLDVYVYPYRVTATAPGCGVIDVLPNSISRDMLGREAVNGLYDYFVSKYGSENSIKFQEARNNFVKSMAAYSVISYLLQFKDRHNGNIMIDDAGHILHIDFGFCFDIAPGGVKFERAPFKLTSEMVAVMGGSTTSQSYKWFEELCIKAFLVSRQHTKKLCDLVSLMLGSGLPCFKPDTIAHLRERFVLERSEREAGDFMRDLIKKSHGHYSTKAYDQFQLMTNGIPY
ncbi:phosphatidylinositol-4- kinase [Pseudocyphellaria aurata]|nr:phosphatidylinositol-4- kinase [Pseudocyphellaria aurata]